jgi:NADP-dependent 3-hydroxy acid dehydrogenase YdfG
MGLPVRGSRPRYGDRGLSGEDRPLALVAGASQGIGRAIATALAASGMSLLLVARRKEPLDDAVRDIRRLGTRIEGRAMDLVDAGARAELIAELDGRPEGLDLLVHSAGTIARADIADATEEDFDRQYDANLRTPFALAKGLLPSLTRARGQIVFVSSSAALVARANAGQYAATQAGLRAMATALRDEVNEAGVRVTLVFPGRTATPLQARIHAWEGRPYEPSRLLQPEDVAAIVVAAVSLPRTAEVTEISIRPMIK